MKKSFFQLFPEVFGAVSETQEDREQPQCYKPSDWSISAESLPPDWSIFVEPLSFLTPIVHSFFEHRQADPNLGLEQIVLHNQWE